MCSHTRFHGLGEREPWVYGEEAETIVRKWLAWRYQLIPYLQGCALQAVKTGTPVMRSMVLAFPQDRIAWQFEQQYMLGDSLLVAPVVVPGAEGQSSPGPCLGCGGRAGAGAAEVGRRGDKRWVRFTSGCYPLRR
jgi:alpha-glucosidase (family GH31 glycosyl hydrolase)